TVIDRVDGNTIYFQNSQKFAIHWEFATEHLSGDGLPIVPDLSSFNTTEYYSPDRRFLLGAVTFYEEPEIWVYEVSPYDTASADMIATAFHTIRDNAYFGDDLYFHPTSEAVQTQADQLPNDIPIITTAQLFEGITYQPLNLATSMGQLTFHTDADLAVSTPWFREIVVLDAVPNDISVVMGIITNDFQTPLSHINVLSQNRNTPNMALIGSYTSQELRALDGKWVELTVGPMAYALREVTMGEADAWWAEHQPDPIVVAPMNTQVTGLWDEEHILALDELPLQAALDQAVPIFGGKATHFGAFSQLADKVPHPRGFAIPVYYYDQFMRDNELWPLVDAMLADPEFQDSPDVRRAQLTVLRAKIEAATVDPAIIQLVSDKINTGFDDGIYPQTRFRFRSSTNAEDVSGFNGAGLYTSKSGDPRDNKDPVDKAMKRVWASLWSSRAYEEREYYSIDHRHVGMALLCHRSFGDEAANGVAITNNIYDTSGLEPAFYINVQLGEESVVFPKSGVTTDQIIYHFDRPNQPAVYVQHSNLVDKGQTVLNAQQLHQLGTSLKAIHEYFVGVYGSGGGFYGMDTEFKLSENPNTGELQIYLKQARPYPGWAAE
ncbi:MAG: hypothetical protein ACI9MC_003161, partial [Kiritimatiellia bacterium]